MDARTLNRILEERVKQLAHDRPQQDVSERQERLMRDLGLWPIPPRTDLNAQVTGVLQREGYRIEKVRYESRPGFLVTAHLYLPEGPGPFPVVLNPHGHWLYKKSEPLVQARGISLALRNFAAFVVDSPGRSWDDDLWNERAGIGTHDDPFLCMGAPIQGVYVWDLMRGLDYLETREDIDAERVGITGSSGGGTVSIYAFALDIRISCAVPVCSAASLEEMPHNGCLCNHVPGLLALGDRADILALRAPAPIMMVGATEDPEFPEAGYKKSLEKLRRYYRQKNAESAVRLELVEGPHDYNRRMREAMLAFFAEHLQQQPAHSFLPELRPLTDGIAVPYPNGTQRGDDPELWVTAVDDRQTLTFRDLLDRALDEPHPEPFDAKARLVLWARFGRLDGLHPGEILTLDDQELQASELDVRSCIYMGLSVAEFLAQVFHTELPGGPEGWESAGLGVTGDALTGLIASMKTLVTSTSHEIGPKTIVAHGPIASQVAAYLKLLRPSLQIQPSHEWRSWKEVLEADIPELAQPNARYLEWPF